MYGIFRNKAILLSNNLHCAYEGSCRIGLNPTEIFALKHLYANAVEYSDIRTCTAFCDEDYNSRLHCTTQ